MTKTANSNGTPNGKEKKTEDGKSKKKVTVSPRSGYNFRRPNVAMTESLHHEPEHKSPKKREVENGYNSDKEDFTTSPKKLKANSKHNDDTSSKSPKSNNKKRLLEGVEDGKTKEIEKGKKIDNTCKNCNRRCYNPDCEFHLCKQCCKKKDNECSVESHSKPNQSKTEKESEISVCSECKKYQRHGKCTFKMCKVCCSKSEKECAAESHQISKKSKKQSTPQKPKPTVSIEEPEATQPTPEKPTTKSPKVKVATPPRGKYFMRRAINESFETPEVKVQIPETKPVSPVGVTKKQKKIKKNNEENSSKNNGKQSASDTESESEISIKNSKSVGAKPLCPKCNKVPFNKGCLEGLCKSCCGKRLGLICSLLTHNIAKVIASDVRTNEEPVNSESDDEDTCNSCHKRLCNSFCIERLCRRCCIKKDNHCPIFMHKKVDKEEGEEEDVDPELCSICQKKQQNISCAEQLCQSCCSKRDNGCYIYAHKISKMIYKGDQEELEKAEVCLNCEKKVKNPKCINDMCKKCCGKQKKGQCSIHTNSKVIEKKANGSPKNGQLCSVCDVRLGNPHCLNKLCKKCCVQIGGQCTVTNHKTSLAKEMKRRFVSEDRVLCFNCRDRLANIRCKDLLCVQCCVNQGENGCEQKWHVQYKKDYKGKKIPAKISKTKIPLGYCPNCKKTFGNVNCISQMCKVCCVNVGKNNGCRLLSHQSSNNKLEIDDDSDTESEEEDEKCRLCRLRSGNSNCIENLCRNCCLKRKDNKCTLNSHKRQRSGVTVTEFKESLSPTEAVVTDFIMGIYNALDRDGFNIPKPEELATSGGGLIRKLDGWGSATYGEIAVRSVPTLCHLLDLKKKDVFYDLGCGVGKTVLLVALQSGCAKSVGIELSRTRYEICLEAYEKLTTDPLVKAQIEKDLAIAQIPDSPIKKVSNFIRTMLESPSKKHLPPPSPKKKSITEKSNNSESQAALIPPLTTDISFVHDNILKTDISDATCIFWNNVCFPPTLCNDIISQFMNQLKPGTKIVCMQKICARHSNNYCKNKPCQHFELINEAQVKCTWTYLCAAYVYVKRTTADVNRNNNN